ncbi:hypothetical protein AGMMS49991_02030 [Spirochaetia bacterium]|nr:hypothetical protein AGMMS49991_02030 [Spirochaetia bacterium]
MLNTKKLLDKITENWFAKVLALALAIIVFVFHQMRVLENRSFTVPLRVELNEDMAAASSYPRTVRVKLRGKTGSIYPILEDDIEVYLDLSRYTEEKSYHALVQVNKNGTALGIEPLEITVDPPELTLSLERKVSKTVPLTPNIDERFLEPGYRLVSYTLIPTQVTVTGPRRLMEDIELSTEVIKLGGRKEDFSSPVRISNPNPQLLAIRGDGIAEFRGVVQNIDMIRGFENLSIMIDALDDRFTAETTIDAADIRIRGNESELEHYLPEEIILRLDCSGIDAPGSYTLPVKADIPEGFSLISSDPAEITIQVRIRPELPLGAE